MFFSKQQKLIILLKDILTNSITVCRLVKTQTQHGA